MFCLTRSARCSNRVCCILQTSLISSKVFSEIQEQEETLHKLNSLEIEELKKFKNVGSAKAERLIAYRQERGEIKTFEELSVIDGFTQSIIQSIKAEGLVKRKSQSYNYILDSATAKEIKSLSAIGIGQNEVHWCLLSRNYQVIDWTSNALKMNKRYNPKEFISQIKSMLAEIPSVDIKVVEAQTFKSSSRDPFLFPHILNKRLAEAIIHATSEEPTASFDPNIIKQHFQLSKGFNKQYYSVPLVTDLMKDIKRRRSKLPIEDDFLSMAPECRDLVQSLVENQTENVPKQLSNLEIPINLIENFQRKKQKDGLANALLLACAFLDIEILNRKDSPL